VWAIVGWIAVTAVAYGIAWLAGWTTLTEGRPLIVLLVGAPYWLAIIALFNRLDSKHEDAKRS
jgi:hypothetical protein